MIKIQLNTLLIKQLKVLESHSGQYPGEEWRILPTNGNFLICYILILFQKIKLECAKVVFRGSNALLLLSQVSCFPAFLFHKFFVRTNQESLKNHLR